MNKPAKAVAAAAPAAAFAASLLRRHKKSDPEHVLRAYYDAWSEGDGDAVRELLADDYCGHVHTLSGTEDQGADDLAERVESHAGAFEQVEYDVEDVIAADGRVAARVTMHASHKETGREAETVGLVILRVDGGRIAEEWSSWDYLGLAEQLGLSEAGAS
jgi:steroid delta-isomerase-like uncharacterized protein